MLSDRLSSFTFFSTLVSLQQCYSQTIPECIGVDSIHSYLCTDTPERARRVLSKPNLDLQTYTHFNFGVTQNLSGSEDEVNKMKEVTEAMLRYFEDEVLNRSEYEHVRDRCKNEHELCIFWTSVGECETNRGFMLVNCAAACRLCMLHATNMIEK